MCLLHGDRDIHLVNYRVARPGSTADFAFGAILLIVGDKFAVIC